MQHKHLHSHLPNFGDVEQSPPQTQKIDGQFNYAATQTRKQIQHIQQVQFHVSPILALSLQCHREINETRNKKNVETDETEN